ncbi:MAG: hypothetical protein ACTFAK_08560 [Candidatus Electronema sp. VV]
MKKALLVVLLFSSMIAWQDIFASESNVGAKETTMTELIRNGYEIKSATMSIMLAIILQKKDSVYLCVLKERSNETSCQSIE